MSRRSLKSSSGTLSSGKRKIQEKLSDLDEEKDSVITWLTSFVEKAKDAGTQLLQEDRRDRFFNQYRYVSEQLQRSIDRLFLSRRTFVEGSDEEEEVGFPDSEECGPSSGIVTERGDDEMQSSRKLKSSGGMLALGHWRIQEKLKMIDEDKDFLIALITSFVQKAKVVGTHLLQEDHRNTFFNQFKSASKELQDCTDSLYLWRTTCIEGSDSEEEDASESDLEGGGESTPRTSSVTKRSHSYTATLSPSEEIQNAVHEFSSIAGSMQSLISNQTSISVGTKSAANEATLEEASTHSSEQQHVCSFATLEEASTHSSEQQYVCSFEFEIVSTSPEVDRHRHSLVELLENGCQPRNSFTSCQEVKPRGETRRSPNTAASKEMEKCFYRCVFPECSSAIEGASPVNNMQVKPIADPPECNSENLKDQSADMSSLLHYNNSESCSSFYQQENEMVEFLPSNNLTNEIVGKSSAPDHILSQCPLVIDKGSVTREPQQPDDFCNVSTEHESGIIESISAQLPLHDISISSLQDVKPCVELGDVPYISAELGILCVPSSNMFRQNTEGLKSDLPEHNDLICFLQEFKPFPCSVPRKSENGTVPVLSSSISSNHNIGCLDANSHLANKATSSEPQLYPPVESCVVQSKLDHHSSDISPSGIRKSESSTSLPLPKASVLSSTRDVSADPLPSANNFHEISSKEPGMEMLNLDDFSSLSSKGMQAEGTCSSSRSSYYSALAIDSDENSFSSENGSLCEVPPFRPHRAVDSTENKLVSDAEKIINTNQNVHHPGIGMREDIQPSVAEKPGTVKYYRDDISMRQQATSGLELASQNTGGNSRDNLSKNKLHHKSSAFNDDNKTAVVNYLWGMFDQATNSVDNSAGTSMGNVPVESTCTDDSSKSSFRSISSLNVAEDDSEVMYYSDDDEAASEDMMTVIDASCSLLPFETTPSNASTPEPAVGSEPSDVSNFSYRLNATLVEAAESNESKQLERVRDCYISPPMFPIGSEVPVRVINITSPSDFYLLLLENQAMIIYLGVTLRTDKFSAVPMQLPLRENTYCLIMSEEKENWLRGKITGIVSGEKVEITLVDFGKRETVHVSSVFQMDHRFTTIPALAIHCYLKGVEPVGKQWSEEALKKFRGVRDNTPKAFNAFFHSSNMYGKQAVDLSFEYGRNTYPLAQYLITGEWVKESVCSSATSSAVTSSASYSNTQVVPLTDKNLSLIPEPSLNNNCTHSELNGNSTPISSLSYYVTDSSSSSTSLSPSGGPAEPSPQQQIGPPRSKYQWKADICPCEVTPNNRGQIMVMISVNISPGEFYVNVASELSFVLDELQKEMTNFYKNCQVPNVTEDLISVGSCWSTQYAIDKLWYRVRVIAEEDGKTEKRYKIRYIDYGNIEDVSSRDLKPLTSEYTTIPAFATRCCLAFIQPVDGASWSREAVQRFEELAGYEKFLIGEVQLDDQTSTSSGLPLLLFDSENLENSNDLTLTLNGILLYEKLAVVTQLNETGEVVGKVKVSHHELALVAKELQNGHDLDGHSVDKVRDLNEDEEYKKWDPMALEYNSVRNSYRVDIDDAGVATVGYKAKDERNICRYFSRNGRCRDGAYCPYQHITHTLDGVTRDRIDEFIQQNKIDFPSQNDFIYVQISSVFNPSHFYVHFPFGTTQASNLNQIAEDQYAQDGDELNELADEMSDHYSNKTFSEDLTLIPALGSLVAVRSEKENQWYRGRVLMVDEVAEKVKVFFIDTGHKEIVHRQNVRKLQPQFCHLPGQAVECFMDVQPADGDTWSNESRNYFMELTVGKILLASVLIATKTCLTIDLNCKVNGEDANVIALLSAKKMAVIPKKKAEFPFQDAQDKMIYFPG